MMMEHGGVEESPGPLPAVKVVRHVIPMKSPPATESPSIVGGYFDFFYKFILHINFQIFYQKQHTKYMAITELGNSYSHHFLTCSSIASLRKSYYLLKNILSYCC